jgi:undecaprenyl-diphosphatase
VLDSLSSLDSKLSERLARLARAGSRSRRLAIVLAHSGDSPLWLCGLALTLWLGSPGWKFQAGIGLAGVLLTALVVQVFKWIVRRPRPQGEWGTHYRRLDPHSFPSGHAARAVMLAVVALCLGPWWWAGLMVVWAPLVSLARVAMRVHYVSDVAAGAVCGAICGLILGAWALF